jgi:hypothetical protein
MLQEAAEMSYFAERYKPAFVTDDLIRHNVEAIKDGR